jgi:hypothetical protein
MTEQPEPSPSSTGQYTGVTGQIRGQPRDDDDDDDDHDEGEGEDRDRPRER